MPTLSSQFYLTYVTQPLPRVGAILNMLPSSFKVSTIIVFFSGLAISDSTSACAAVSATTAVSVLT